MKKTMFSNRSGMTEAVLQGRKTVTRRLINKLPNNYTNAKYTNYCLSLKTPPYEVGEIVAVAQSYFDIWSNLVDIGDSYTYHGCKGGFINAINYHYKGVHHSQLSGWNNKMFVKAALMPHQIRILDVRAERLQDITEEDCLAEGILLKENRVWCNHEEHFITDYRFPNSKYVYATAREAFATLIDKISGKGTWERNPYVWRIEFELVENNQTCEFYEKK